MRRVSGARSGVRALPSDPALAAVKPVASGAWAPLGVPTFRAFWLAVVIGNIGTWIHDVAASWVMAEATGSALMVAAVQAATTLPMVLLALFAGALADIVDRRKYLLVVQLWMLLVASSFAVLSHLSLLSPALLVGLTFALGVGAAMGMPAQQATTPELVPRPMLGAAVALGSLSVNIARSIGPAIGGLIMAQAGAVWAFGLNALSFVAMVLVLIFWRREIKVSTLPPESFGQSLRAGLRYARQSSPLKAVLAKTGLFFLSASALMALLPIVVNRDLNLGAGTYGLLLGCVGVGAITGAVALPRLRARLSADRLILVGMLSYAVCIAAIGVLRVLPVLYVAVGVSGFAWIAVLSSLQIAAQTAVSDWVKARALSLYIVVFSGGLAGGSLLWGAIAQLYGTRAALLVAAMTAAIGALAALAFRIGDSAGRDVMPSAHWSAPPAAHEHAHAPPHQQHQGPVLVTVEYRVAPEQREAFLAKAHALGHARRRDGATQWSIAEDAAEAGVFLEYFTLSSWLDHLRQHERVTGEERRLQESIQELLVPGSKPLVRHFLGQTSSRKAPH